MRHPLLAVGLAILAGTAQAQPFAFMDRLRGDWQIAAPERLKSSGLQVVTSTGLTAVTTLRIGDGDIRIDGHATEILTGSVKGGYVHVQTADLGTLHFLVLDGDRLCVWGFPVIEREPLRRTMPADPGPQRRDKDLPPGQKQPRPERPQASRAPDPQACFRRT